MMQFAVPILVVVLMVSVGLELSVSDVSSRPGMGRWLALGLTINLVAFPLWTWVLIRAVDQSSGFVTGLILCAAAPGGPVGPVLARLSRADLGFATVLMILLGGIGLVTTPVTVWLFLGGDRLTLVLPMFSALLLFQILPLGLAMVVRRLRPRLAAALAGPASKLANLLLVAVVVGLLATRWDAILSVSPSDHGSLAGGLLVVTAGVCHWSAGASFLRGLLVVTAVRNMSIALLLSTRLFSDPQTEVGILVWGFWMIVIPATVGSIAARFTTSSVAGGDSMREVSPKPRVA